MTSWERSKAKVQIQTIYFLGDIIRNKFSLEEQEVRKEKCVVNSKFMDFINSFELKYDLLVDKNIGAWK